jgi:hypothetical protein
MKRPLHPRLNFMEGAQNYRIALSCSGLHNYSNHSWPMQCIFVLLKTTLRIILISELFQTGNVKTALFCETVYLGKEVVKPGH